MAAPDSWEDMDDGPPPPPRHVPPNNNNNNNNNNYPPNFRLSANAPTFAFNPGAVTFAPNYGGAPPGYYPQHGNVHYDYGQQPYAAPQAYGAYPHQSYGAYPPGYVAPGMQPTAQPQQVQGYGNQRGRGQPNPPVQYENQHRSDNQQHRSDNQHRFDSQQRADGYRPSPRPVVPEGNGVRPQQQQHRSGGARQAPASAIPKEGEKEREAVPAGPTRALNSPAQTEKSRAAVAAPAPPPPSIPTPSVPTPSVPTPSVPTPSVPTPSVPTPSAPVPSDEVNEDAPMDVEPPKKEMAAEEIPQVAAESSDSVPDAMEVAEKVAALDIKDIGKQSISTVVKDEDDHDEQPEHSPSKVEEPVVEEDDVVDEDDDQRDHLNLVFIGHVDAGKSTIGGQILYLSEMVDKRTIEKFEREAKDKNRESWYMAYIMDTNEEERAKGKTVEVGRAHFETVKRRYTILDAPGHKNYVPNMISGASQADVGVLVIAARKGEFETGFERGGQTREHAQLAKTLGVSKLVVVVNKMDDPSVNWAKERFDEIVTKMTPFLKLCGYNTKKDVQFLPISGLMGINMKERMGKDVCPWWDGSALFETLDALVLPERDPKGLFRMPLIDKYRDMGTVVMGKIESGSVRRGDSLLVMPNKVQVKVVTIFRDNDEVKYAKPGENLRIRISGIEEEDILPGFVLSSIKSPIMAVVEFDAQLQILELLDHKAIFTAGYKAILHVHSVVEECEIIDLLQQMDPKTRKMLKRKPLFVKSNAIVTARIQVTQLICVELFSAFPQLGRFTLRDEGKTVAIGKVMSLVTHSAE